MPTPAFASAGPAAARLDAVDIALLQSHVKRCGQVRNRWSEMRTAANAVHHFFAPRFATTLTCAFAVIVLVSIAV